MAQDRESSLVIDQRSNHCARPPTIFFIHNFCQMLAHFQNYFVFGFSKKFAIKPMSCFPPLVNHVATLPCESYFNHFITTAVTKTYINIHSFCIMQRSYASMVLRIVILSVCLSVTRVLCDEMKERTADNMISHEGVITLVF